MGEFFARDDLIVQTSKEIMQLRTSVGWITLNWLKVFGSGLCGESDTGSY